MKKRRPKLGRVSVPFEAIETIAAEELAGMALGKSGIPWKLTRHSALHRCKNGTFTLHLVWHDAEKANCTLTKTVRGLRIDRG